MKAVQWLATCAISALTVGCTYNKPSQGAEPRLEKTILHWEKNHQQVDLIEIAYKDKTGYRLELSDSGNVNQAFLHAKQNASGMMTLACDTHGADRKAKQTTFTGALSQQKMRDVLMYVADVTGIDGDVHPFQQLLGNWQDSKTPPNVSLLTSVMDAKIN